MNDQLNGWANITTALVGDLILDHALLHSYAVDADTPAFLKEEMAHPVLTEPTTDKAILKVRATLTEAAYDEVAWADIHDVIHRG